jgi:hypothetical protein
MLLGSQERAPCSPTLYIYGVFLSGLRGARGEAQAPSHLGITPRDDIGQGLLGGC